MKHERLTATPATMTKVVDTLMEHDLTEKQAVDIITAMQNRGILFRERA